MIKRACTYRVFTGERSDFGGHTCLLNASVQEDGKWWCKTHAPSAMAARRSATTARWDAETRRADARYALKAAERAVLDRVYEFVCTCDAELERLRSAMLLAAEVCTAMKEKP